MNLLRFCFLTLFVELNWLYISYVFYLESFHCLPFFSHLICKYDPNRLKLSINPEQIAILYCPTPNYSQIIILKKIRLNILP